MERSGAKIEKNKIREQLRHRVAEAFLDESTERRLIENLRASHIDLYLRRNDTGHITGVTFIDHESRCALNDSQLGKEYSANPLNELYPEPMQKSGADLHTLSDEANARLISTLKRGFQTKKQGEEIRYSLNYIYYYTLSAVSNLLLLYINKFLIFISKTMYNITEVSRRDIIDLFRKGYVESGIFGDNQNVFYGYYGRLSEVDFLKKLYTLNKMVSYDSRYENAEGDIWQHTVNNDDWESDWVFSDDRFELLKGADSILLDFLCAVFHPENRYEQGYWKEYLSKINGILKADGYELYENCKISQRSVFSWRKITQEESVSGRFIPFSVRNKKDIEAKKLNVPTISKKLRSEIIKLFNMYDEDLYETTETGWNYNIKSKDAIFRDIGLHYVPHAFDNNGKYSRTENFDQFIMNNYPFCVFDAIELFSQLNNNNFVDEINLLLKNNDIIYKLASGKMEVTIMSLKSKEVITEPGLKELVTQATTLYNNKTTSDKQLAVEKIWDALERLKTYYSDLDKKKSSEKIISDMSNQNDTYKELFNDEFLKLTKIGNDFRIRHHETNKTDIIDNNYYDYFFLRCYALIDIALKYLK
jgi:hypothetical protein